MHWPKLYRSAMEGNRISLCSLSSGWNRHAFSSKVGQRPGWGCWWRHTSVQHLPTTSDQQTMITNTEDGAHFVLRLHWRTCVRLSKETLYKAVDQKRTQNGKTHTQFQQNIEWWWRCWDLGTSLYKWHILQWALKHSNKLVKNLFWLLD